MYINRLLAVGLTSLAFLLAGPARAGIDLRVESRPNTDPIDAFVHVTDGSGSVAGLTAADFAITLDGAPLNGFTLGLPPDQDPSQRTSIAFFVADPLVRDAVVDSINQMSVGDYAAVIRLNAIVPRCCAPGGGYFNLAYPKVQPFTEIDGGLNSSTLIEFATKSASVRYPGPIVLAMQVVALNQAVAQFVTPPVTLPDGPKAIVLVGDLRRSSGLGSVMAAANASGVPIFTVSATDLSADAAATALMASIAADTGAHYFPARTDEEIADAFASVGGLLNGAYRLVIPDTAVTDCSPHMLEVTSRGESASFAFTRCDSTPDDFHFANREGIAPGAVVVSDAVTITGIESPVAISVTDGEYSIGCVSTFTSTPGFVLPDDEVCVRHTAAAEPGTSTETLLVVGGVSASFWSSTSGAAPQPSPPPDPPPPPRGDTGGGGGGGASGVVELILALSALLARRRSTDRRSSTPERGRLSCLPVRLPGSARRTAPNPFHESRLYGMVHVAIHDALNSIERRSIS